MCRSFHPVSLEEEDLEEYMKKLGQENLAAIKKSSETIVEEKEIIRLVAVLCHNGLTSGMYKLVTMFNHSCCPNCQIFIPQPGSLGAAEIWTIKPVKQGEELRICYSSPIEQSSQRIRRYLLEQHKFLCTCPRCLAHDMVPDDIKDCVLQVESELDMIDREIISVPLADPDSIASFCQKTLTDISLLQDTLKSKLDTVIKARMCKVAIKVAMISMEGLESIPGFQKKLRLHAYYFLVNNLQLLSLQYLYLSADHPDCASTLHDICEVLESFISRDVEYIWKKLFATLSPFAEWVQSIESIKEKLKFFRLEYSRVKKLYDRRKQFPESFQSRNPGTFYWGERL